MAFTVLLRCRDLERGLGRVVHPNALDRKYLKAGEEGGLAVGLPGFPELHRSHDPYAAQTAHA